MIFSPSPILPEVIIIEPDIFPDERGYFMETYHQEKFTGGGISPKALANYDSLGTGPRERFIMGRRFIYSGCIFNLFFTWPGDVPIS